MTEYTPDKAPTGGVWVCMRCGRYNKVRSVLHETCACAPEPGLWDSLAESSTIVRDNYGRVIDFHHWYDWSKK